MNPYHAFLLGIGCTLIVEALAGIVLMAFLTRRANKEFPTRGNDYGRTGM